VGAEDEEEEGMESGRMWKPATVRDCCVLATGSFDVEAFEVEVEAETGLCCTFDRAILDRLVGKKNE
jgi:hypothetical protein